MSDRQAQEGFPSDDALLNMSDEDLANLDLGFLDSPADDDREEEPSLEDPEEDAGAAQASDDGEPDNETDSKEDDPSEDVDDQESDDAVNDDESASTDDASEASSADPESDEAASDSEVESTETVTEDSEGTQEEIDYKAAYERITAPFKANGKELKVDTVDEAIQLMQMGANYHKKMAALKPNLKMLKLLEKNDLLSEEKLSYLIDLEKKNPDAIKKLVKDSGIDPLDIDTEKESEYKPQTYTVDDRELELDAVLDRIEGTATFSRTIGLVSNKWDARSKQVVAENPQLLEVINDHMASGVYDRISGEIEKQRVFGRLTGLSDLEAYRLIGDELQAKGAFDDLFPEQGVAPEKQPPQRKTVVKTPKQEDPKLKSKKRAASSTRTAPNTSTSNDDFNPLALDDEAFEKLINEKLM